ncbi:CAP domain-containing protein [Geopyxis carbonaria]|nr:CAP domain-containing protein [Geopyxis carbonaria]
MLYLHNAVRLEHNSSRLRWNSTLRNAAQAHADACRFTPSNREWGENLTAGFTNATAAVRAWISEREDWRYGELKAEVGHFTQMVWNDTRSLGCGASLCDDVARSGEKGWLVVCAYWPRGNVDAGEEVVMMNVGERVRNLGVDGSKPGPLVSAAGRNGVSVGAAAVVVLVVVVVVEVGVYNIP